MLRNWQINGIALTVLALMSVPTGWNLLSESSVSAQTGVQPNGRRTSASVLSEHEIEALDDMSPQSQAELLLERSINHFRGANEQIGKRAASWRGQITLSPRLDNLFITAINSDDLAVRVAGIEIDIAARDLELSSATIDLLEPIAKSGEQGVRVNAMWNLGLLGNRGVEPDRVFEIIAPSVRDTNQNIRYWVVESLAYLGTERTIPLLLEVFHDDPSATIRERAACSLAQSGMLNEQQRRRTIPVLLDFSEDPTLDDQTHKWVFQALRDITGESLPPDSVAWRKWYKAQR